MSRTLPDTFAELQRLLTQYRTAKTRREPGGLDPGRGEERVITLLQKTGPLPAKDIAYLLGAGQGELAQTLERMAHSGFIRLNPPSDGPHTVHLTEKGAHAEFSDDTWKEVFCVLSAKEALQLEDFLDRLTQRTRELLGSAGATDAPNPGAAVPRVPGSRVQTADSPPGITARSAARVRAPGHDRSAPRIPRDC